MKALRAMRPQGFLDRSAAAAVLLIVAAIAGSGTLAWWADKGAATAPADGEGPVYSVARPDSLILDARGKPLYRLYGSELSGPARGNRSVLQEPRLEFYPEGAPPWFLLAERAWIAEANRTILLEGKVRIWNGVKEKNHATVCLETEDLRLYPDERRARTHRLVRAYRPGATLAARGIRADLARGQLELLGEVRGTLAPPHSDGGADPAGGRGGEPLRQCLDAGAGPGTAYRDGSGDRQT